MRWGRRSDEAWFSHIGVHKTVTLLQPFLPFLNMSSTMRFSIVSIPGYTGLSLTVSVKPEMAGFIAELGPTCGSN